MTIELPPNGTGTILETRTISGRDRQLIGVAEPIREVPTRGTGGRVVYVEDFRQTRPGIWNDGVGYGMSDCDVMFNGLPSLRIDTGAQSNGGATNPGRTAITTGAVYKRRILSNFNEKWGVEGWFRLTSLNLTSNSLISMSIYNRDGNNAYHGRVWLDPNGNNQPMHGRILDGAATNALSGTVGSGTAVYADVVTSTSQNGGGTHNYEPKTGRLDLAGGWHYVKMVVDFSTLKYVSLQLDSTAVDISGYDMDVTASTGYAGMHHSWEFSASTTTRRFINIAHMVGTLED